MPHAFRPTAEDCRRSAENKQTLSCVSPSFVSPSPSERTKTIPSPWAMHSFVERRTQIVERSELCQAAAWGILRYWRKTLQRFILGLQNTVNDTKHDIVKRCVKQKFDVGLVRCRGFVSTPTLKNVQAAPVASCEEIEPHFEGADR